ncbi:type II toxin-antitoxin system prevent-host-death family antitoxin [Acidiferrobacter sp.]|uniref:type II toxin-antitoxin system Phd/YefM family antitoxin n=1 Tax=Acidiferrobacter sp. TaxID=1872107 RepID=UPI0026324976|nr:type II toxin-antitoxin system prevent-host-death family antitoxin [Acidiferrobacter sp.]
MDLSIRDMKNHLSKYLKLVRAGKDVVITDCGKPVAQLTPIKPVAENEQAAIARINALPWVQPGKGV